MDSPVSQVLGLSQRMPRSSPKAGIDRNRAAANKENTGEENGLRLTRWASRLEAVEAVQQFATAQGKQALVDRSTMGGSNVTLRCASRLDKKSGALVTSTDNAEHLCAFRVPLVKSRGKNPMEAGTWCMSKSAVLEHRNSMGVAKPKLRELMSSTTMRSSVQANRGIAAKSVADELLARDGVNPPNWTIYRAKNNILDEDDKTYALDYQKIAAWCDLWEANGNANGSAVWEADSDNAFVSVTVVCKAAAKRCMLAGQDITRIDGAFMKHKIYRGQA